MTGEELIVGAAEDAGRASERMKPRQAGRRTWDHVYYFMPIVLSFALGALWYFLNAAFVYGSLTQRIDGKFELLNYRLEQLEKMHQEQVMRDLERDRRPR